MGDRAAQPRIIMDVTDLCCWAGRTTGIIRVDREISTWAMRHHDRVAFAVFDPSCNSYREIREPWLEAMLAGRCHMDRRDLTEPAGAAPGRYAGGRQPMRRSARWVLRFRRELLSTLETRRVTTSNPAIASFVDQLQRLMMNEKYRKLMLRPDGSRQPRVTPSQVLGNPIRFDAGDILFSVGSAWVDSTIEAVVALKREKGIRYVVLCHDIIALQFPQYVKPQDVDIFRRHFHIAFPTSDLVLCASKRVAEDVQSYCISNGLGPRDLALIPFGSDPTEKADGSSSTVHHALTPDRFILHVSTIEPRKGHRVLLETWRRLLRDGIPQRHGFQLVLVGQIGWKIDDLRVELEKEAAAGHLVMLPNVDDAQLMALYRQCAFCVYPSEYEGFGLPVIEAFRHGKAVIASTGGALPEVASGFAPCLEPGDVAAWTELMARWISDREVRRRYEDAIRTSYRPISWSHAAARVFETIDARLLSPAKAGTKAGY